MLFLTETFYEILSFWGFYEILSSFSFSSKYEIRWYFIEFIKHDAIIWYNV